MGRSLTRIRLAVFSVRTRVDLLASLFSGLQVRLRVLGVAVVVEHLYLQTEHNNVMNRRKRKCIKQLRAMNERIIVDITMTEPN